MTNSPYTVDVKWLHEHMNDPTISIVSSSGQMPTASGEGTCDFNERHIPGSVYFDIDVIADQDAPLAHTLASPEAFAREVGQLGISEQDTIVVYDGIGIFSAARVWWNFRIMGAKNVFILDGGFPAWVAAGLPIETTSSNPSPQTFNATDNTSSAVFFDEMNVLIGKGDTQVADARANGRFTGEDPEPREGMRSGHMPGAKSVPFTQLLEDGKLRPADQLREVFHKAGIELGAPIVTTCGSGVTAAVLVLALETIGHENNMIYDGSWTEWGGRKDTDIVTGN